MEPSENQEIYLDLRHKIQQIVQKTQQLYAEGLFQVQNQRLLRSEK